MAENQNCSETPINTSVTRRKTTLPTLSRVLKSQTSSFQHRACPNIKNKPSIGGFKVFLIKTLIGCGAIYLTASLGVWGEPEESAQIYNKIKHAIIQIDNEKIISNSLKTDVVTKIIKSKDLLKKQLDNIPEEVKACYDKSEKYISDLIKGKKF